jgi:hypothetical protein
MTAGLAGRAVCDEPLSWETMVAYWLGDLPEQDEWKAEEHYLGCQQCADQLFRLAGVAAALRAWHRSGRGQVVVTEAALAALRAAGQQLLELRLTAGQTPNQPFPPEIDFVVARLAGDLAAVERLDLELSSGDGLPFYSVRDAPFDPASGEVLVLCERHLAASHSTLLFRLHLHRAYGSVSTADYLVSA